MKLPKFPKLPKEDFDPKAIKEQEQLLKLIDEHPDYEDAYWGGSPKKEEK